MLCEKIVNVGVVSVTFIRGTRIKFAFGRAFNARKSVALISLVSARWLILSHLQLGLVFILHIILCYLKNIHKYFMSFFLNKNLKIQYYLRSNIN